MKGAAMMKHKSWRVLAALLAVFTLALLMGCGKKNPNTSEGEGSNASEAQQAAAPIDKSTVGEVNGSVKYAGAKPAARKIDMSQDPVCAKKGENTVETITADGGNLANVFVYVKEGLGERNFPAPTDKATIDQEGCRYHPHVLAVMTGQPIEIKNDDNTTHNIHPTPAAESGNREWNESQPPKGAPLEKSFSRPEVMLPVKCNQHPWMKMYINVAKTPYFAVTDKNGKFDIKDLPPGKYTLAAVHETLGEKTQDVTIAPKQTQSVDFNFGAGAAGAAQ